MSFPAYCTVLLLPPLLVFAAAAVLTRPPRRWYAEIAVAAAVLTVLTGIFDGLMVAVGLFDYDESRSLGVSVFGVPLEDFAWPLAAALAVPSLWRLASPREPDHTTGRSSAAGLREHP